MFRVLMVLLGVLCMGVPVSAGAFSQTAINADWRFMREDVAGAPSPGFDDANWLRVTLPHSFNAGDGEDGGTYYRGVGWYRKSLDLKAPSHGDRIYLQFDGAALVADLYVNGQYAGRHEGGYTVFRFDITRFLVAGKNLIAVKVDNARWPHIAPLGGDFTISGGLHRGVSLIQTRDVGLDWLDHGASGVAVRTDLTLHKHADLDVEVALRNHRNRAIKLTVNTRIFSADGKLVTQMTRNVRLKPSEATKAQLTGRILTPRLWHGRRDPYLYAAVTEISDDNETLERVVTHFGVRQVVFDAQRGLLLNGEPYEVVGVNLHAGRAGKGMAVSDSDVSEDFDLLDDLGVTGVRLVHYPHGQVAYQEADRRGILILTEIPLVGEAADTAYFKANITLQLRELIRQNINHPSIIAWGLGDEIYSTDPYITGLLMALDSVAVEEDISRPSLYAHCCQADDHPKAQQSRLVGFNRYFGWYDGVFADIGRWADGFHAAYPEKPFAVLEYGAGGSIRHQSEAPARVETTSGWHPESFQTSYHEANWAELKARPFIWGKFVWQAFDSASDGRNEGDQAGINDKGLITYDRKTRKDAFWFYKAQWSAQPFVYVTGRRFHERTERVTQVKIYSNQPSVTLTVNGVVVGTQTVQDGMAIFNGVNLAMGSNTVRAESGVHVDEVRWTVRPAVPILN